MKPTHIFIFLFLVATACAQTPSAPAPQTQQSATANTSAPAVYTLPPDKMAKSEALHTLRVRMLIVGTLWSFLVPLGLLYGGVRARFPDWAGRNTPVCFVQWTILV